ncbi:MAG: hypothetical protein JXR94_08520 [Candidatus Hydrogenedentes bacterium]|nr:hypothetical protein [Candidatus Hydrogenedentota bacterium]
MDYRDSVTGAHVRVLTPGPARDDLIYQTHPMWTPQSGHLVFNSDRTGSARLPHALQMDTGVVRCLVPAPDGDLPHPDNWTLSREDGRLYLRAGDGLYVTTVADSFDGTPKVEALGHFDGLDGLHPISMSLDADERRVYFGATFEPDASWGIVALDLDAGGYSTVVRVNFRVGHIQANPITPGLIMFCHETGGDAPQRMWVVRVDGSELGPFYKETYDEWVTHEVWWGADRAIFTVWPYDDAHRRQPHGVISADLATGAATEHSRFPAWHVHGSPDRHWAVADDQQRNIWLIRIDTGERRLLTQGHNGEGFGTHPHPSFTPDGAAVVFNSSRNQTEDIFLVDIPEWDSLPEPSDLR